MQKKDMMAAVLGIKKPHIICGEIVVLVASTGYDLHEILDAVKIDVVNFEKWKDQSLMPFMADLDQLVNLKSVLLELDDKKTEVKPKKTRNRIKGQIYGYTKNKEIIPEEAEVIVEIFHCYSMHVSKPQIVKALNNRGIFRPRSHNNIWSISGIYTIISCEKYRGRHGYPQIVQESLWKKVFDLMDIRRPKKRLGL